MCLDFHHFLTWVVFPKFGFDFSRRAVAQALVEPCLVPPIHPLERRDFHVDHVGPRAPMNQLILVGTVDILRQSIVVRITNSAGRRRNSVLSPALVVDDAHIV